MNVSVCAPKTWPGNFGVATAKPRVQVQVKLRGGFWGRDRSLRLVVCETWLKIQGQIVAAKRRWGRCVCVSVCVCGMFRKRLQCSTCSACLVHSRCTQTSCALCVAEPLIYPVQANLKGIYTYVCVLLYRAYSSRPTALSSNFYKFFFAIFILC